MSFFPCRVGIWTRDPSYALEVNGDAALGKADGTDGLHVRGVIDFKSVVATTTPINGIAQTATNTIAIRTKDVTNTISEDRIVIYNSSTIDAKQNLRVLIRFLNSSGVGIARGTMVTLDATGHLQVSSAVSVAACEGTVGSVFADTPDGTYGFVQVSGIAFVLTTTTLVPGGEAYLSPTVAGYVQPTPAMVTGQADFVVGAVTDVDQVLLRMQLRGAIGNVYDESIWVVSGVPADDNEITGPVAIDTEITLPLDSRNFNTAKAYPYGSAMLQVFLNGQLMECGVDYLEVGPGPTSTKIQTKYPLVVNDEITFRIDLSSTAYFAMSGGGSGTGDITNGQNLGIITDGESVFAGKSGTFLQFKRIKAGTGCTVTSTSNSVVIDVTGGGGGAVTLDDLTDVIISGAVSNQFLRFNGTNWVNQTVTLVTNLDSLTDVVISSPSIGQVLTFNGVQWVNSAAGGGGATDLNALTDVTLSSPVTNQVLKYNGTQWVNAILNLSTLPDVTISGPTAGQVLTWNGSVWVNSTPSGGGGSINLDGLTDVTISTPTTNQILKYSGSQWVNGTYALTNLSDVNVSGQTNNQVLAWNSSSSKWVNTTIATGSTTLAGLTDVLLSSPLSNQFLRYNGTKWVNQTVSIPSILDDLSDVTISGIATGHVLTWDGAKWANAAPAGGGGGVSNLYQLNDVALSGLGDDQALVYELSSTKWKNVSREKLIRKTYDSGRITIYASGSVADVNNISAVKSGNSVTITSVSGTAKLVSVFAVFSDTETASTGQVSISYPDPNGSSSLSTSHIPSAVRAAGDNGTSPPTIWAQTVTSNARFQNISGTVTCISNLVATNSWTSLKLVW